MPADERANAAEALRRGAYDYFAKPFDADAVLAVVERAVAHFSAKYPVSTIDGVRMTFPNGWGLIRASNTQPILVMRFEADTEARLALLTLHERSRDWRAAAEVVDVTAETPTFKPVVITVSVVMQPDGSALIHLLLAGITLAGDWGIRNDEALGLANTLYVSGNKNPSMDDGAFLGRSFKNE